MSPWCCQASQIPAPALVPVLRPFPASVSVPGHPSLLQLTAPPSLPPRLGWYCGSHLNALTLISCLSLKEGAPSSSGQPSQAPPTHIPGNFPGPCYMISLLL